MVAHSMVAHSMVAHSMVAPLFAPSHRLEAALTAKNSESD